MAFCPERVVQGYGIKELREMPQIVSATTENAEREATEIFRPIAPELVVVKPIEAEFAKLFNNAYRYIEFAASNQFYMIAKSAGADYQSIMRAMKQNYPRARSFPGPGRLAFASFKDTMQLLPMRAINSALASVAMQVNEGLVLQLVDDLRRAYKISEMTVGLLGMAFKAEIDDTRASLSYKLKRNLQMCAQGPDHGSVRNVRSTHSAARAGRRRQRYPDPSTLHSVYAEADLKGKPVVDVWGFQECERRL